MTALAARRRQRRRRRLVRDDRAPAPQDARCWRSSGACSRRTASWSSPRPTAPCTTKRGGEANHFTCASSIAPSSPRCWPPAFRSRRWYAQRVLAHSAIWAEGAAGDAAPAFMTLADHRPTARSGAGAAPCTSVIVCGGAGAVCPRCPRSPSSTTASSRCGATTRARLAASGARVGRARCAQSRRGSSRRARAGDQCARQRAAKPAHAQATRIDGARSGARRRRKRPRRRRSPGERTRASRGRARRAAGGARRCSRSGRRARRPNARLRASSAAHADTRGAPRLSRVGARLAAISACRRAAAHRGAGADGDRRRRRSGASARCARCAAAWTACSQARCTTPYELVVVDDGKRRRRRPPVTCRSWRPADARSSSQQPSRQGYAAAVNRASGLHRDRDVVVLQSDAEVANDWLDRLAAHAAASRRRRDRLLHQQRRRRDVSAAAQANPFPPARRWPRSTRFSRAPIPAAPWRCPPSTARASTSAANA